MGELCAELAALQERTGRYFNVPDGLTAEDLGDVRDANRLLSGEVVEESWTSFALGGIPEP